MAMTFLLTQAIQHEYQYDWGTLKRVISVHFMNQHWQNQMKLKAQRMQYQQSGHKSKLPTKYYNQNLEHLELVSDLNDTQLIMEIVNGMPQV
jgi:hypothetical protein